MTTEPAAGASHQLRLPYAPPFDAPGLVAFLAARAIPGVEEVDVTEFRYRRGLVLGAGTSATIGVDLRPECGDAAIAVSLTAPRPLRADEIDALTATCRRSFALDVDARAAGEVVGADPVMAPLVARVPGLRVPGTWDPFELAARAVLGQQVSVAAARTLLGRLAALATPTRLATPLALDRGALRAFPSAAEVAAADLDGLGVPASRRRTLRALAEAMASGTLRLEPGTDSAAASARLQELPGVGPWTAAYVVLRALGDTDSFLAGDLALARAAARQGLPETWPALIAHAERWRPWRGYASFWLWSAPVEPTSRTRPAARRGRAVDR